MLTQKMKEILLASREDGWVLEPRAKRLLSLAGLEVPRFFFASKIERALEFAKEIGYPVVGKVVSPKVIHKSEKDGVEVGIRCGEKLIETFDRFSKIDGFIGMLIEETVSGLELIIGAKNDFQFGPVILFGMGGVGVELFKDYSMGLPPLNTTLIRRMMEETKIYKLLKGYRGASPVDIKQLEQTLLLFSQLMTDFPQIKEIDINPLLINEKGAVILDARIVIDKKSVCKTFEPHEHLIISPYPKKYEMLWTLRNGQDVLLRPIKPEDEPMWLEMFQNFSEESIRYRFFQMLKDTPHEVRVRYCNIDYDREVAIVAELLEEGRRKILGVSRVSIEPDGKSGEMAFIVGDRWQNLGLGTKMVDYTLDIATQMGVNSVYAIMLPDNYRALSLTKKMGFDIEYLSDGTVKGTLSLKEEPPDKRCILLESRKMEQNETFPESQELTTHVQKEVEQLENGQEAAST